MNIYSIAAHRGFADALVAGLIPRYAEDRFGLARLTLLLPSRRAVRTVTEAFVRLSGEGLLLPRMAVIGDIELDETLGPLLDPIGDGADVPPAADQTRRWLSLAAMLEQAMRAEGRTVPTRAALLRQAREIARALDRLQVEGIDPADLLGDRVRGIVGDLAHHWEQNLRLFWLVQAQWSAELERRGEVDAPTRRNALFDHAARRWREAPPAYPIVAAGVTSASPAIARLLRVVAGLSNGAVVLPDLDLSLDDAVWDALGTAGHSDDPDEPPLGAGDAVTHPQYHLKLLLNRMGVNRGEVRAWHRRGMGAAPPERSKAISNLFLPPEQSASWVDLPPQRRKLAGVRIMETAHPEAEAKAIAVLIREALEVPEKRIALVTPDRGLAGRVIAHLASWNIRADDSAGMPLPQTVAGRLFLHLAEVIATRAAPLPLLSALSHPFAGGEGDARRKWLQHVRRLDLQLRGPRLDVGLEPPARLVMELARKRDDKALAEWWQGLEALLAPLVAMGEAEEVPLLEALDALATAGEALCGTALWANADGRALAGFVEDLRMAARDEATPLDPAEIANVLRDAMDQQSVRPLWGGHPRIAIYGLIEARMSRADLVICGGLTEGSWPAPSSTDPLIAPAVLRALGVPGGDFRIGLAAHDLAAALGAPEVVLSHARRDVGGPVIASRFVLRVKAMLGDQFDAHVEAEAPKLAEAMDEADPAPPYPRPEPKPDADQRKVEISATALDRLRSDPYQFYASHILRLRRLESIDEEPTPAWKGTAVHAILQQWYDKFGCAPGTLLPLAAGHLSDLSNHPFMRGLWQPRLMAGLAWVEAEQVRLTAEGREVVLVEKKGEMRFDGVTVTAKADRIDRLPDGTLAVVDYKTGMPPSASMVEQGFALQLGTTGLIAESDGFDGVSGTPTRFEYWSLAKGKDGFGYMVEPILEGRKKSGIAREDFLFESARFLKDAIDRWIVGSEAFTARLNPDLAGYNDYDQLMRLDEWQGRDEDA
ncbi:double-strand break repair protein AddB [Croceicoccus naphthovorans]|uniref:Helicase n=1 Tax=Croceicoccus naphthovorans TaxID=1348774 RepID=A0A0G3XJ76_9SPHN|nr:double-strand break repair protein AddB [Croceicoccus naphthovorans]AKM11600.1 helicase [Croceicoccus naphthovorans]MBB3990831.1 ATP-dependent helicase/nuclease subunit B [Croceicoccus naphthovorans]